MHSSGFDDAATRSLMIEGTAGDRLWDLLPPSGDHPTSYDRGRLAGRMTTLVLYVATFLPPSRPWKSEDALRQTELLSVGTVCADVPVPMVKEISGRRIEQEQAQIHRYQREDGNDSAE